MCIRLLLFFYTWGLENTIFHNSKISKVSFIGCVSRHVLLFSLLFLSSRPPQTMRKILEISVARRKYLCVTGKVVLWSTHFDIRIVIPMFYLKLCYHIWGAAYRAGRDAAAATAAAAAVCCSKIICIYIYIHYILYNC